MREQRPKLGILLAGLGGIAAAGASGLLYALAFPPAALGALAWVALVPLLLALSRVGPLAGAGLGLVFSGVAAVALASWLPGTIGSFFDLSPGLALLYTAGALSLCIFPYAGIGACIAWAARRDRFGPWTVALAWAAGETLRVYGAVPTPWGLIAYTQASWLPIVQSADLVGPIGVGCLIAAVNGAAASIVVTPIRRVRLALPIAATAAAFAAAWLYGLHRLDQEFARGAEVDVAVVQPAIEKGRRFDPAFREANLERHVELTRTVVAERPDLVAWPELAIDFLATSEPELWRRVRALSQDLDGDLLLGAPHTRRRNLLLEPLNSVLLLRGGRIRDRHDKVELMPFSETRPTALPIGHDRFLPGLALRPLPSASGALGVLICSEALHPQLATELASSGAELIVNPSNDDWFGSQAAAEHQVAVAVFRAVETRRYVLRPSTSGRSAIVDPHGRVVALAPYGEAAVLRARVRLSTARSTREGVAAWLPGGTSALAAASLVHLFTIRRRLPKR